MPEPDTSRSRSPDGSPILERRAGRALILAEGSVLMIRGIDPADPGRGGFWWTPGGGLDDGESLEAGTCREARTRSGARGTGSGGW